MAYHQLPKHHKCYCIVTVTVRIDLVKKLGEQSKLSRDFINCQSQTMWPHFVSVHPLVAEFGIKEDDRSKLPKLVTSGRSQAQLPKSANRGRSGAKLTKWATRGHFQAKLSKLATRERFQAKLSKSATRGRSRAKLSKSVTRGAPGQRGRAGRLGLSTPANVVPPGVCAPPGGRVWN